MYEMKMGVKLLSLLLITLNLAHHAFGGVIIRYCIRNKDGGNVIFHTLTMAGQLARTAGNYILANDTTHTYQESLPGNLTRYSELLVDNILTLSAQKMTDDGPSGGASLAGYQVTDDQATYYFKPFEKADFDLNQPDNIFVIACKLNPSGATADKIKCNKYTQTQMTAKLGNANWYKQNSPYSITILPEVCDNDETGTNIYP